MKQLSIVQAIVLAVLGFSLVGCAAPMGASGSRYEDFPDRGDVYYGSPYGRNTIIVERDPFTGRYYQVSPGHYGNYYGSGIYPYPTRRYAPRVYRNPSNRYPGTYRPAPQQQQPRETPQQRQEKAEQRERVKESILGPKKSN